MVKVRDKFQVMLEFNVGENDGLHSLYTTVRGRVTRRFPLLYNVYNTIPQKHHPMLANKLKSVVDRKSLFLVF